MIILVADSVRFIGAHCVQGLHAEGAKVKAQADFRSCHLGPERVDHYVCVVRAAANVGARAGITSLALVGAFETAWRRTIAVNLAAACEGVAHLLH